MKVFNRFTLLSFSVILVLSTLLVFSFSVSAEESGSCGDDLTWTLDDRGTLTVSGSGPMYDYVNAPWYSFNSSIKEIVIENGVTHIGKSAFNHCSLITEITIPESVISIGGNAFYSCTSLKEITMPGELKHLGSTAFEYCTSIEKVTFLGSVMNKEITSLFPDAVSIKTIVFADTVTKINSKFLNCMKSIETVIIPDTVEYIGNYNFEDTAFYNNEENWDGNALYAGKHLIAVKPEATGRFDIKSGTLNIAGSAFKNCSLITDISIPATIKSFGPDAFKECTALENVYIEDSDHWGRIDFDGSTPMHYAENIYVNGAPLKEVTIKDGNSIDDYMFYNCYTLEKVTVLEGTKRVGTNSFNNCEALKTLILPRSVEHISETFFDCTDLTICCYKNSYAHKYAKYHNIDFILICDHSFTNYTSDNNAKCGIDGTKSAACDNGCGAIDIITDENSAIMHIFTHYETLILPTCSVAGIERAFCDNGCGHTDIRKTEPLPHTVSDWSIVKQPSDKTVGEKIKFCSVCSMIVQRETIPTIEYKGFSDVSNDKWYSEGIKFCAMKNYMLGTDNGTFKPEAKITANSS